jgi:hypothetical protein
MTVKISEILNEMPQPSTTHFGVHYLDGAIGPDTSEGFFRVYMNANNKNNYFVLRTDDVVGDLHKWTEAELAHSRIVGQERYRIPIKPGAVVHKVRVQTFIAGVRSKTPSPQSDCAPTSCNDDSDCPGCQCCNDTNSNRCQTSC